MNKLGRRRVVGIIELVADLMSRLFHPICIALIGGKGIKEA